MQRVSYGNEADMTWSGSSKIGIAILIAIGAAVAGCHWGESSSPPSEPVTPAAAAETPTQAEPAESVDSANAEQEPAQTPRAEEAKPTTAAEFEPPYPQRINPFLTPKRSVANNRGNQNRDQDSIELLGFVNVGVQKVILSINGIVVPVPEGGTESGVEVISIQPPAVVLQSNRERWQATLEN